jgi:hypothetical protein
MPAKDFDRSMERGGNEFDLVFLHDAHSPGGKSQQRHGGGTAFPQFEDVQARNLRMSPPIRSGGVPFARRLTLALIDIGCDAFQVRSNVQFRTGADMVNVRCCLFTSLLLLQTPLIKAADIVIGRPKIYDERALQIMLDDLERQLSKTTIVDQSKLEAQLGVVSGINRSASSFGLSLGGPSTPGIVTTNTPNAQGQLTPSTQTVTVAASTPAAPSLPTTTALASPPSPGINAESLLTEQIDLTYRIYNLRLLLNRSVTDRLLIPSGELKDRQNPPKAGTRKQVLVGFTISIQPTDDSKGREAYVRVEVGSSKQPPPEVVSLLPQEKTYNVATISDKAASFGFAVPISVITLGLSAGVDKQTLFVYRDADTVARLDGTSIITLEKEEIAATDFGWSFRPVLGRDYVEPGIRQVFVNLALNEDENSAAFSPLQFSFASGWRELKDKMAVKNSATLPSAGTPARLDIPETPRIRQGLGVGVESVAVAPFNDTSAIVSLGGRNFFPGTSILIGDEIIDQTSPKLTIPSDDALTFVTTLANLESGFATVYGRYGLPAPIVNRPAPKDSTRMLKLSLATKPQPERDSATVQVQLRECADRRTSADCQVPAWLRDNRVPILISTASGRRLVNGSVLYPDCLPEPFEKICFLATDVELPKDSLSKEQRISVSVPFGDSSLRDGTELFNPLAFKKIVKLSSDTDTEYWLIQATGLKEGIPGRTTIRSGKDGFKLTCGSDPANKCPEGVAVSVIGETAVQLAVKKDFFKNVKQLAVITENVPPFFLPLPPLPKPDPSLTGTPSPVIQNSATTVDFTGTGLDQIKSVTFAEKKLQIQASDDGSKLSVFLDPNITAAVGSKALAGATDSGVIALKIEVKPK